MATRLKKTDVVIIGLGAAGGIAALPLARAGLKVVGLEAGKRLGVRDYPSDEIRNDVRNWLGRVKVNNEVPTWRPTAADVASQTGIAIRMMNGVGGTSIHYGMENWRFLPWHFRMRSETIKRYGAGALPPDSTLVDWPVSYGELEPYYDKVEYDLGVSGKGGNIRGRKVSGGNPFEGPRRRDYPLPPLRSSGWTELVTSAASRLGWHPWPGPAAIRSREYKGLPGCEYCGFCTNNGCHTNAKGATYLTAIAEAERTRNLKVVTLARVTKITTDRQGRVTGVSYLKGGELFFQPADVVLLATYVYENVRLLLLSKSRAYPKGLSNNAGQVGQHYISHVFAGMDALFAGRRLNRFSGSGAQRVSIDDWNGDNFDHSGLGFIGGGVIDARMEAKPIGTARGTPPSVPRWGSAWKAWVKQNGNSLGSAFGQLESLPYEGHFLDLDPKTKDPQGFPVVRVTFALREQERLRHAFFLEKCTELLKEAGATETWVGFPAFPIAVNSHAYGGSRMGNNPDSSVVDRFSMSHEAPNLGVLGGSCFPSSSGYNPTETVQALAWRTGDHLVKNWNRITA